MHLDVWTCLEFQRESQDGVCLAVFRVREEKDFPHRGFNVVGGDSGDASQGNFEDYNTLRNDRRVSGKVPRTVSPGSCSVSIYLRPAKIANFGKG